MGGILLYKPLETERYKIDKARDAFSKKGYRLQEEKFDLGDYSLYYYRKFSCGVRQVYCNEAGDFIAACGSLIYGGKAGSEALEMLNRELESGRGLEDLEISGNYILVIFRKGRLMITRDLFGGMACYTDGKASWFTSNFLSAIALNDKNSFRRQELLEYILFGFCFGNATLVDGIQLLESTRVCCLFPEIRELEKGIKIPDLEFNYEKCLENNLNALIREFKQFKQAFGDNVVSALSGGFDSRLMLCLQLEVGIKPRLYVYGRDDHPEVLVAKEIARGENLELLHVDKSKYEQVSSSTFKEITGENFWGLDGYVNVGFLGDRSDLQERINRGVSNGLLINGAGGEIYRDVWQWNFRKASLGSLFNASYNTGELERFGIVEEEFFGAIEEKMSERIRCFLPVDRKISRQEAEIVFPVYRGNFYFSNNTLDNYFSHSLLPYMSQPVTLQSFSIPYRKKRYGLFEMDLIRKLNPRIAAYRSSYGFNFIAGPGAVQKMRSTFYSSLSPAKKAHVKRLLGSSKKSIFNQGKSDPSFLDEKFVRMVTGPEDRRLAYFLPIAEIKNPTILNRIWSMEILAGKFGITS